MIDLKRNEKKIKVVELGPEDLFKVLPQRKLLFFLFHAKIKLLIITQKKRTIYCGLIMNRGEEIGTSVSGSSAAL